MEEKTRKKEKEKIIFYNTGKEREVMYTYKDNEMFI